MAVNEEQSTEIEVLQSIYDGDSCFHMVNDTTFQYKFGEEADGKSFLLEISWPPEYPEVLPSFNFNAFYNNHISSGTKAAMVEALNEEANKNLGVPQVYTIFEWVRDGGLSEIMLSAEPSVSHALKLEGGLDEEDEDSISGAKDGSSDQKNKAAKREQLSKSQKRKEWNRLEKGEKIRGHDWVDVVKHLSQTGFKADAMDASPAPADAQALG